MLQYGGEAGKLAILAFPCNQFGNQEPGVVNMLVMVLVKQVLVKLVLVKLVLVKLVLVKLVLVLVVLVELVMVPAYLGEYFLNSLLVAQVKAWSASLVNRSVLQHVLGAASAVSTSFSSTSSKSSSSVETHASSVETVETASDLAVGGAVTLGRAQRNNG